MCKEIRIEDSESEDSKEMKSISREELFSGLLWKGTFLLLVMVERKRERVREDRRRRGEGEKWIERERINRIGWGTRKVV